MLGIHVFVESVEFDETELLIEPLNVRVHFVVYISSLNTGRPEVRRRYEGTLKYSYNEHFKFYTFSECFTPGLECDQSTRSTVMYFVSRAFRSRLEVLEKKYNRSFM